jgi:hypothetical protein
MNCSCLVCTAPPSDPITSWRDRAVSHRLDALIVELEGYPSALRARWLRLHKRFLEMRVPRFEVAR